MLKQYTCLKPPSTFPLPPFLQDAIYTNVADVLISVNPYKSIPLLYEVPLQQMQNEPNDEFEDSDGEREVSLCHACFARGSRTVEDQPKTYHTYCWRAYCLERIQFGLGSSWWPSWNMHLHQRRPPKLRLSPCHLL